MKLATFTELDGAEKLEFEIYNDGNSAGSVIASASVLVLDDVVTTLFSDEG